MTVRALARRLQDRLLRALGRAPDTRAELVRSMLQPRTGDATGYWLQLGIATLLATLGLALDSTAVVIGAMLIAPLMRPLVELAMGLATGSAALVLRSMIRTGASIAAVTLTAVAITTLLPFHEVTAELSARTVPSLLDLVIAGGCALAAAYAAMRSDTDIATTAAGTSVGISLVPPLCATGYGIAVGDGAIARGAALLFTANLSGILVIAAFVFVLAGFGQVDVRHEEDVVDESGAPIGPSQRVGRVWSKQARRLGPFARLVPPLILLGLVYVPLHRAVIEIGRRNAIRQDVASVLASDRWPVVQYDIEQTATDVIVRAIVVGETTTATDLEHELTRRLSRLGVATPRLSVWAVPDAKSVSALERSMAALPPPVPPPPPPAPVHRRAADLLDAVKAAWPPSAGAVVGLWLDPAAPGHVRIDHLGPAIGPAALELLARTVDPELVVGETSLEPAQAAATGGTAWLIEAENLLARAREIGGVQLCVTMPPVPVGRGRRPDPAAATVRSVRDAFTAAAGDATFVTVSDGPSWTIEPRLSACTP